MMVSPHFDIREFVPKAIYEQYGANSIWFIDQRIIEGAEWLRTFFNAPIVINNWHTGGKLQERGFRVPTTTTGARLSQHKFGRAIDFYVHGLGSDQVASELMKRASVSTLPFTTIEDPAFTKGWTHLDLRNSGQTELLIVKP